MKLTETSNSKQSGECSQEEKIKNIRRESPNSKNEIERAFKGPFDHIDQPSSSLQWDSDTAELCSGDIENEEYEDHDESKTFVEQLLDGKGRMWDREDVLMAVSDCNVKIEVDDIKEESFNDSVTEQFMQEESTSKTEDGTISENCVKKELQDMTLIDDNPASEANPCKFHQLENSADDKNKFNGQIVDARQNGCDVVDHTSEQDNLQLNNHVIQMENDNHKCSFCDYSTHMKGNLRVHVKAVHLNEKKHKCKICDYTTSRKYYLKLHVEGVHLKVKNFKCHICDYAASVKSNLKVHVNSVHLNVGNYECQMCDYTTPNKSVLKIHVKSVHLNLRNNKCHICDYATPNKNVLKIHVNSVHLNVRNHKCPICDYASSRKSTLKVHINDVHRENRNLECQICDYTAAQKCVLQRHMNIVHRKSEKL